MSESSVKPVTHKESLVGTTAISSIFVALVPGVLPNEWQEIGYQLAPISAGIIVFFLTYIINVLGLQGPQEIGTRNRLKRDLKEIDTQLSDKNTTPELKQKLLQSRGDTVLKLSTLSQQHMLTPKAAARPEEEQ